MSTPPASSPPGNIQSRKRARQVSSEQHEESLNSLLPGPPNTIASKSEAKRRREAASSNTSSEDGFSIVQEEWRAGAPFLCITPASTFALDEDDIFVKNPDFQRSVLAEVRKIAERNGVIVEDISGPDRRRGLREADDDRPDRVVLVGAVREENNAWYLAIQEILNYFHRLNQDDLNVEFMDERESKFYISPIESDDRMVSDWVKLRPLVMAFLNDGLLPIPWLTVDCFRYGYQEPEDDHSNPCTVIITLEENSVALNAWWLKRTLEGILTRAGADYIAVRVQRGGLFLSAGDDVQYRRQAAMGDPISLMGDKRQGTLGGSLLVHGKNGETKRVGVTCHHVVQPRSHPYLDAIAHKGYQLEDTKSNPSIMQPSYAAHKAALDLLDEQLGEYQLVIMKGQRGRDLDDARNRHAQLMEQKRAMQDFWQTSGELGTVWCSSGNGYRRTVGNARLDWALIEIAGNRQSASNEIPPKEGMAGEFRARWMPHVDHKSYSQLQGHL